MGANSHLSSIYGPHSSFRGNNPDGLWRSDGDRFATGDVVGINFDSAFGMALGFFEIDIAAWVSDLVLRVFDMTGNEIFNSLVIPAYGAFTDPGVYAHFVVNSGNGISAFHLSAGANATIRGNTSIDNVRVVAISEPCYMGVDVGGACPDAGISGETHLSIIYAGERAAAYFRLPRTCQPALRNAGTCVDCGPEYTCLTSEMV